MAGTSTSTALFQDIEMNSEREEIGIRSDESQNHLLEPIWILLPMINSV